MLIYKGTRKKYQAVSGRADSVRKYLIEKFGIDASRITAVGYGPDRPIASNDREGKKEEPQS